MLRQHKRSFPQQAGVEVKIWEGSLLRNTTNLRNILFTYSLDNGPVLETSRVDGITFRFTRYDWERNIQNLLLRHNIHHTTCGFHTLDSPGNLLRKKIFIAEDDPDVLFSLSTILSDAGYQVKESTLGKPVIDGSFLHVDLFILDKQMPDIDGLELCRHLRSQHKTKMTPVIIISATRKSGKEAEQAGVSDYIEKPFHLHYLLNIVSRHTRGNAF